MSYNAFNNDDARMRMLDGAELGEATAQAVLVQLADLKRMLDEMREQRNQWRTLAKRRALAKRRLAASASS
jgi:hypothetical protein